MKTDTANKIIAYITQKNKATAKELAEYLKISPQALFRQLKKLIKQGKIQKKGKPPRVFYYDMDTMKSDIINDCFDWASKKEITDINADIICQTQDVFKARYIQFLPEFNSLFNGESLSYTLMGIIAEIGNNSFDHNLGNWRDVMGAYFKVDIESRLVVLADRGQGVLKTISEVRPDIVNAEEALRVAFTEVISGRSPEQRGNGLKYVKNNIQENNFKLTFYTGNALCFITMNDFEIRISNKNIAGVMAIIEF